MLCGSFAGPLSSRSADAARPAGKQRPVTQLGEKSSLPAFGAQRHRGSRAGRVLDQPCVQRHDDDDLNRASQKAPGSLDASKMANIAPLCAYLKGRSDGAIQPGR